MANPLSLELTLKAVDKMTAPLRKALGINQQLGESFSETRARLIKLNKAQSDLSKISRLQKAMKATSSGMKDAQKQAQYLGRELARTTNPSQKLRREFEQARHSVRSLKEQQRQEITTLQTLRQRLNDAGFSARNYVKAQQQIRRATERTNAVMRSQLAEMQRLQQKQAQLSQLKVQRDASVQRASNLTIAAHGAMNAGQRATRVMQEPANVAISFEKAMSKVKAIANLADMTEAQQDAKVRYYQQTEKMSFADAKQKVAQENANRPKQFNQLRDQSLDLGGKTSFSASEVAGGQSFLAMAGFKAPDIIQTMPGMLDLAKSGDMGLARTADISSNILSGFGMNKDPAKLGKEMTRLGDVMAYTFTTSNVDMSMLGETMKYVAPIAAKAGSSVEETAAMAGMLGDVGIQGSMAGTTLRAAFLRLADAPKPAMKALKSLGVTTKDSNGQMKPMIDVLEDLKSKMGHLENGDQIELISTIFGQEAASGMTELMTNVEKLKEKYELIKTESAGTAKQIAKTMGDNTAGKIKNMKSAMEGLQITIGDALKPSLDRTILSITGLIRKTQVWMNNNKPLVNTVAKVAFTVAKAVTAAGALAAGIAAVMAPMAMLRYSFKAAMLQIGGVGTGLATTTGKVSLLSRALRGLKMLTGFGLIAVGAKLVADNFEKLQAFTLSFKRSFVGWTEPLQAQLKLIGRLTAHAFKPLLDTFSDTKKNIQSFFKDTLIQLGFKPLFNIKSGIAGSRLGRELGKSITQRFSEKMPDVLKNLRSIQTWSKQTAIYLENRMTHIGQRINQTTQRWQDNFKQAFSNKSFSESVEEFGLLSVVMTTVSFKNKLLLKGFGQLKKAFTTVKQSALTHLPQIKEQLTQVFSQTFTRLMTQVNQVISRERLSHFFERVSHNIQPVTKAMGGFISGVVKGALAIGRFLKQLADFLGGWDKLGTLVLAAVVIGKLAGVLGALASIFAIISFLATPIGAVVAAVMALGAAGLWLYRNWETVTNYLNQTEWGQALLWIIRKVGSALSWLGQTASDIGWSNILSHALKVVTLPFRVLGWIINKVIQLANRLIATWNQVANWWNNLSFKHIAFDISTGALGAAWTLAKDVWNWWNGTPLTEHAAKINTAGIDWAREKINTFKNWWDSWSLTGKTASVTAKTEKLTKASTSVRGGYVSAKDGTGLPSNYGGGRAAGGSVASGMFYEVNEVGPELFTTAGRTYLMMGGSNGLITPLTQAMPSDNLSYLMKSANEPSSNNKQNDNKVLSLRQHKANKTVTQTHHHSQTIQITINPAPGMDERALVDQLERRLRELEEEKARLNRGNYFDEVS